MTTTTSRAAATVIVYAASMAESMWCLTHIFGLTYLSPAMPDVMVYFVAVMAVIAWFGYRAYARLEPAAFPILGRPSLSAWFIPAAFIVIVFVTRIALTATMTPPVLRIAATVSLFVVVGFAEELVFRGVVLSYFLGRVPPVMAVIASALVFSAFHGINILGGLPPAAVFQQLILTLISGIFFAGLALAAGCLWPVMIVHFAWDLLVTFAVQSGSATSTALTTSLIIQFITVCAMLIWVARRKSGISWQGVAN